MLNLGSTVQIELDTGSLITGICLIIITVKIFFSDRKTSQRQQIFHLWPYLVKLDQIDFKNPNPRQVSDTINTLELVGLSVEAKIVDEVLIKRVFRNEFIELYNRISSLGAIPELQNKTGKELIHGSRPATALYNKLSAEHLNQDKPK